MGQKRQRKSRAETADLDPPEILGLAGLDGGVSSRMRTGLHVEVLRELTGQIYEFRPI